MKRIFSAFAASAGAVAAVGIPMAFADGDRFGVNGKNAKKWSSSDVRKWLGCVGLGQYGPRFGRENVDGEMLLNDISAELAASELGVKQIHVKKFARELAKLKAAGAAGPFPNIASKHSLVAKHLTEDVWAELGGHETATAGVTLTDCIACSIEFDNQHCGIYAGDEDCYTDFAAVFDPIIEEYHGGYTADKKHISDMDVNNIKGNINSDVPVASTRIRVGRSIEGFGLSPGITRQQRLDVEALMAQAFKKMGDKYPDLAGEYYPLLGMDEDIRQQLVNDHFLFKSGDPNLKVGGMERDWPEGRGIFHNKDKTFLVWVNEEDQLRIISMQQGGNVKEVFERLARGINAIEEVITEVSGRKFMFTEHLGYLHSCPTNLGTGMRASVHVDLEKWAQNKKALKARCEELNLQPRGAHGESSGDTGVRFDISNKHRLGYSEVELVQTMIDGVNKLWAENK